MIKYLVIFLLLNVEVFSQSVLGPNRKDICVGMVITTGGKPVDQALIKIYDKEHHFLCDKFSDTLLMGFNWVQDSLKIKEYGVYYVEIEKQGYRTLKTKIEVDNSTVQNIPELELLPETAIGFNLKWIVGISIMGILVILFFIFWRCKFKRHS